MLSVGKFCFFDFLDSYFFYAYTILPLLRSLPGVISSDVNWFISKYNKKLFKQKVKGSAEFIIRLFSLRINLCPIIEKP